MMSRSFLFITTICPRCFFDLYGYYQWNWKTPTSYANSCKTLKLGVGDGSEYMALFQFKK
jgi:hypothetical protein